MSTVAVPGPAQDVASSLGLHIENARGSAVAVDSAGNIYMTGNFRGDVDFDFGDQEITLTGEAQGDMYLLKIDASGNFVWVREIDAGFAVYPRAITIDSAGDVLVTGGFDGIVDLDPGPGVYELEDSTSAEDLFILKLDSDGMLLWATAMGDGIFNTGFDLATDSNDNVYVAGTFDGTVDFDPGTDVHNLTAVSTSDPPVSYQVGDGLILKLTRDGNFVWVRSAAGDGRSICTSVDVDQNGGVFVSGIFVEEADLDPGPAVLPVVSSGRTDAFAQKLDSDGQLLWAGAFVGDGSVSVGHVASDHLGNLYCAGRFTGTADFDPGPQRHEATALGGGELFVQKLDADGGHVWTAPLGGGNLIDDDIFDLYGEQMDGLAVDRDGNIYTTGYFSGFADVDPGPGIVNTGGSIHGFVHSLDPAGALRWAKTTGSSGLVLGGGDIAVDEAGNVYATGIFWGSMDGDPGPAVLSWDYPPFTEVGFLWRLSPTTKRSSIMAQTLLDLLLAFEYAGRSNATFNFMQASLAQPDLTRLEFNNWDADKDGLLTIAELTARAEDSFGCFAARENAAGRIQDNLGDLITLGLALGTLALLRGSIARERG